MPPSSNVIGQLCADHREIQALLDRYFLEAAAEVRKRIRDQACTLIRLHCALEAGIVVPAVAEASANPLILEQVGTAYARVMQMINELVSSQSDDERQNSLIRELSVYVNGHIKEAESDAGLIRQAERLPLDWASIEVQLDKRRSELTASMRLR